jgi:hypothetical protein
VWRLKAALRSPRLVATALLAVGGLITYLINFPGSMEYDSFVQLVEARSQSYSNWHPAVMSWLLGISDTLPGPVAAWIVGFDMVLAFGTLIAVLWLTKAQSWVAVAAAAVMLVLPQLFLLQAIVWKDALFADAVLTGFVLIGFAAKHWPKPRVRYALLAGSAVVLALTVLTRQNGVIVLPCAAAGLAIIAAGFEGQWRGAGYGAGLLAAVCVIAFAGNAALQWRWDGEPSQEEQFKILRLYDITGMVRRDPALPLTVLDRDAPSFAKLIRGRGVRLWSPVKNDTLEIPPIIAELEATPAPVLKRQWQDLIVHYPGHYLAVRAELFRWVFQPPDIALCHPFHVGDEGDPADLRTLGVKVRLDARDEALKHYGEFFEYKTPVFSHALFAAIGLMVLGLVLRRREPADIAVASLIIAAFAFTATFAVVSIACDYRYLYLLDLSALTGVLYVTADWRALWPRKRGPEGPL